MSQSLSKIWTHLIFSTKDRYPFLSDRTVRRDMHAYLASILKANHCPTLVVGGVADHVHSLFVLSKNHSIRQYRLGDQTQLLQVGERAGSESEKVSLAGRLRSIFCKPIRRRTSAAIYSRSGNASSEKHVPGRISQVLEGL